MARIELKNICMCLDPSTLPGMSLTGLIRGKAGTQPPVPFSIQNLNLTIPHGRTMLVLGPSGCGKTTLLKIIAGLLEPDSGEVRYDGVDMRDIPAGKRRIGMIFQNYALYPHLTSKTNILSYFYFRKKTPELDAQAEEKYKRTSELMGVSIEFLKDRKPTTLSGGERQRVALGRCVTRDPVLFLLDEPFSNLDQKLREKYRVNLKVLLNQFNITTVYVTHDQQEALILADCLAIMDIGRIEQVGTYEEIYNRPKNIFIAEFLNLEVSAPAINLVDGRHLSPGLRDMTVGVRPEEIEVSGERSEGAIRGTLANWINLPVRQSVILNIHVGENEVVARATGRDNLAPGMDVWLTFRRYHLFDKVSGLRVRSHPAE